MSNADFYLLTTLLVYTGVAMVASWGLDLQIGETNVLNFGFNIAARRYRMKTP